jgi:hypothetical protein
MTFQKLMISVLLGAATLVAPAASLSSPDGNLKLTVDTNSNGTPLYELTYKNKTVIA